MSLDYKSRSALHIAAENGAHDTVRSLLTSSNNNINGKDADGNTALHTALYELNNNGKNKQD